MMYMRVSIWVRDSMTDVYTCAARKKQLVKQAPVDVRRYWAAKEGLKNM